MKKLITITLVLALLMSLLLPAAALAIGKSPFFGKWMAQKHGSTANYSAILYYLHINENTPCDYFQFCLHHGGVLTRPSLSDHEEYSSQWEIVEDHLKIPTSAIEYIEVFYNEKDDTLYTKEWPKLTFVRIP